MEGGPRLSQRQPPGGPVQQADAQPVLQAADLLGDRRFAEAENARRRREAAGLDDRGEDPHLVQTSHGDCFRTEPTLFQICLLISEREQTNYSSAARRALRSLQARGNPLMTKVLVLYYSTYGHIETMAKAVAEGARGVAGTEVTLKRVPELMPDDIARKAGVKLDQEAPVAKPEELADYDAIIFGTPTRFGNMA